MPRRLALCAAILSCAAGVAAVSAQTAAPNGSPLMDARRAAAMDIDVRELPGQVPPPAPGDTAWPYYNNRADGIRYSDLAQIDEVDVGALEEACRVRVSGPGPFSSGPVLVAGVLYLTAARETLAIQPATCDVIWKSIYAPEEAEIYNANRGVAFLDGRIFRGTGDGRLVAYDAATGRELWRRKFGDPKNGEYVDAAPLAWDGKVFAGLAAGDLGIAGKVAAFDAKTGEPVWSFNTVPRPGEFGNDTWPGETWKTGGGGIWSTFTLDAATGELFAPVANPAPAFDPGWRRGANLFTNAVLVLDARTGKRLWHFQTRPNDNHDYGVSPPGVLIDLDGRKLVAQASKDGFVYLIDRASHALVWKASVTTIRNHDADATAQGVEVCPGAKGGEEYNSPGYDPKLGLLVVGAVDWCYRLFSQAHGPHIPGDPFMGGRMERADDAGTGWITALDARTGKAAWRYHTPAPVIAGVTPTAGGITFAGDASGALYVFRTRDGTLLRRIDTGGALAGGVITYQLQGRQYVAVNTGNISRSSWGAASGTPTLIVYRLPETGAAAQADVTTLSPDPAHGRSVYASRCSACHGATGQGGEGPPLRQVAAKYTQAQAAQFIAHPKPPMPRLFPSALTAQDVADVAAYVRTLPPQ
jgi:PQQ-dependent dehydrogenase (methanol/ethanol family)